MANSLEAFLNGPASNSLASRMIYAFPQSIRVAQIVFYSSVYRIPLCSMRIYLKLKCP